MGLSEKRTLILVHDKERRRKMKQKNMKSWYERNRKKQRQNMAIWYQNNKSWYKKYRKANPDKIKSAFDKYRKSTKGIKAIKRYERSAKRKALRAFWEFKKRLQVKVDSGEISKSTMYKKIQERLREKPIPK